MNTAVPVTKSRASFSTVNPKLQIAWDSVSMGAFKKCPRYYQYAIVEGWQGKGDNIHLRYGQLYHRALEVYDHHKFEGESHEQALRSALRDLAEGCQNHKLVDRAEADANPKLTADWFVRSADDSEVECAQWWNPEEHLSEEKAKRNTKTIENLFRTVIWYLDEFEHDPCKTVRLANGRPAVEMSFRYEVGHTFETGEEAMHSGHLDRLTELGKEEDYWVMDRKTTQTTITGNSSWGYFAKFCPDNQMSGYTYAGKVILDKPVKGIIIDAAQIAKGFSRFERGLSLRTEAFLEEWMNDFKWNLQLAETYAKANYWPMNDTACDHYGGCTFRGVCSKDPAVRKVYLEADFIRRPWDPLEVRGDI